MIKTAVTRPARQKTHRAGVGALVLAASVSACTSAPRFRDQPIVWRIHDTQTIPEPRERLFLPMPYFADILLLRRLTRAAALPDREPAHNTNALDEVPDSSWFTNRIGVRRVSPAEAAQGASSAGLPKLPLTIVGGKSGGGNPGFVAADATGRRFLVKFDTKENPGMQTAASIIVNRIFWTAGYFVPNDQIIVISRGQLQLDPRATLTDTLKRKRSMSRADVDTILASSPRLADGRYRISTSEFLPGVPKGGFPARGVRVDDPNDTIPHQHRRELRGLRVLSAWVNHTDMKEDNTLDVYVTEGGRRFLRHYLLDFGEALGSHGAEKGRYEDGYEHLWDWQRQPRAFLSFGLWKRPWEDAVDTRWIAVGAFSAKNFDPSYWREAYPYWPFFEMDAADAYWAAKIVMRFDHPILRAIVARAQLSPSASNYLVHTLYQRRKAIGRTYLEALTALDDFGVRAGDRGQPPLLCATDLGIIYDLATHGVVQRLDSDNKVVEERTVGRDGGVCLSLPSHDRYMVYRIRIVRGRAKKPPLQVHLQGGKRPRVLGIIRDEDG